MPNKVTDSASELLLKVKHMPIERQESQLLEQLGAEVLANSSEAGASIYIASEASGDLQAVGRRILRRLEREANALLCGTSDQDKKDREDMGIGRDSAIGAITLVLTSGLGVAPAIAAVAAALIIRRLAEPSIDEACKYWSEQIDQR